MTIGTFDTSTLMEVLRITTPSLTSFWLDLAFPRQQNFETQYIDFDVVSNSNRVAPFVAPNVQGKPMLDRGYTTRRFSPAYVKPKGTVDPSRVLQRRPGEGYGGTLSPEARRRAIIAAMTQEFRDMVQRRWELMAAEAIITGKVVVAGELYPSVTVDFQRAAGHTIALTGGSQWGQSGVKPLDLIETWSTTMMADTGMAPTQVIMGTSAWNIFRADADVKDLLSTQYRGSSVDINRGPGDGMQVQFRGTDGARSYYTYAQQYLNDAGTGVDVLSPKDVILINPTGVDGVRAFGAIMDAKAGYRAVDVFPSNWMTDDPSQEWFMLQSAPLMIPRNPNATMRVSVLV